MSVGQYPKDSLVMNQALKVCTLRIRGSDSGLYSIAGGNTFINIREPVNAVYLASVKVDSGNTTTLFNQAVISIVDSVAHTVGGDKQTIELVGLAAVAANDVISLEYVVLEHL